MYWYCRYGVSYRDLERMMVERGVSVDHSTIFRWVQKYAPSLVRALRDARGSPPWTPWTIRSRLDRPHHAHATYAYVGGAERCDHHAGLCRP